MIKKPIIILIAIFTFNSLLANDKLKDKFTSDLNVYITAYNNKDWNRVTDFLYPKLFTLAPKEAVIENMAKQDESGLTMLMSDINVIKISEPIKYKEELFHILDYNLHLELNLDSTLNSQKDFMKSMFINQYGKENVKFNKDMSQFSVKSKLQMIAISSDNGVNFYYLENAKGNDEMLKAIFDAELIKLIKKNE